MTTAVVDEYADATPPSRYIRQRLAPDEKIIYRARCQWFTLVGTLFSLLFGLALGALSLLFSVWQQNVIQLSQIPMLASQDDLALAQGIWRQSCALKKQ